jgi:hypothetical protein
MLSMIKTTETTNELCPFCGKAIPSDESSRDHVFGEAFGGRIKVPCCEPCNSTIGHGIEGPLHAPDSLLAFARAGAGLAGRPLRGQYRDDGTPVNVNWTEGGAVPRDPAVKVTKQEDTISIQVGGTEQQVRKVWRGLLRTYGSAIPTIEEALASATRTSDPLPWIEIELTNQLPILHKFAAKVALSGGAAIWGDIFTESPFADALRDILATLSANYDPNALKCDSRYLSEVASAAKTVAPVDIPEIPLPNPGPGIVPTSPVVFVPVPRGGQPATAVFVTILNFSAPPYGILLSGAVPGNPTLPIVLREELGGRAPSP